MSLSCIQLLKATVAGLDVATDMRGSLDYISSAVP